MQGSPLAHFAVNADDVQRARRFYEAVLGWRFTAWGPPDFYQIDTDGPDGTGGAVRPDAGERAGPRDRDSGGNVGNPSAVRGALQRRRELAPGERTVGFECTFAVTDVDAVAAAVKANGGDVVMEKTTISGVGELVFFRDTEGNVAGAMRYDSQVE
jgi:uncharacterized protein